MFSTVLMCPKDADGMASCVYPGPEIIKKFHAQLSFKHFSDSDKPRMLLFLLMHVHVKVPTIFGILTFVNRKKFMLSSVEHEIFYNLRA